MVQRLLLMRWNLPPRTLERHESDETASWRPSLEEERERLTTKRKKRRKAVSLVQKSSWG